MNPECWLRVLAAYLKGGGLRYEEGESTILAGSSSVFN